MSDSSDDVEEEILRPRGRFAAGMQSKSNPAPESESESDEEMRDDTPKRTTNPPMTKSSAQDDDDEDDEDEIVTTRPRKLQQRPRQRTATPEPQPRDEPTATSPGLFVSPEKQAAQAPESPGLFVSPAKPSDRPQDGLASDDEELPSISNLQKNPRFQALVEKKRKEREAREAEEERKKAERRAAMAADDRMSVDGDDDDISDDEGGRKLTQKGATKRPSQRKASKKALEDMNRETQRMARELQLAHEPKVKNKITKATLFERFNFRPAGAAAAAASQAATAEKPAKGSSVPQSPATSRPSDTEKVPEKETPPSSPPVGNKQPDKTVEELATSTGDLLLEENSDGELPTFEEALTQTRKKLDKGKGKATAADFEAEDQQAKAKAKIAAFASAVPTTKVKRNVRVKFPLQQQRSSVQANTISLDDDDDDDDELQVKPQTRKSKIDAIFDRVPLAQTREPRPLQMLRKLAHIDDPEKLPAPPLPKNKQHLSKHQPPAMTSGALEMTLLQRARAQAKREREEHLEMLRAKGVVVMTAEERAKEMQEVEDIVARARREAEEIMAREREVAKEERRKRKANGEEDPLGWDDSEDDDESFVGSEKGDDGEDGEEGPEVIELSGSEEEEEEDGGEGEDGDEDEDMAEADPAGALFDESAGESGEEEQAEKLDDEDEDEDELPSTKTIRRRPRKQIVVLSDDDEDEDADDKEERVVSSKQRIEETPRPKQRFPKSPTSALRSGSPSVPTSVLRSARKSFIPGLPVPVAQPAGLGLTQIFAGTMDDSQSQEPGSPQLGGSSPSQPRPTFDIDLTDIPDSNFSQNVDRQHPGEEDDMILDSQPSLNTGTRHKKNEDVETQAALETQGGVQLGFSQSESQMHGFDSLLLNHHQLNNTQGSELIEPTQDQGYKDYTPLKQRFVDVAPQQAPHSTVETVLVGNQGSASVTASRSTPGGSGSVAAGSADSPSEKRPLGRLRRRGDVITGSALFNASTMDDDEDDGDGDQEMEDAGVEDDDEEREAEKAKSAFEKMKRAAEREKRLKEMKKKSKAREMVEEQAEESEDEYAGLGGIDGEGDTDEEDAELVKEMIDDETKAGEGDERKLAAFYA